MQKVHRVLAIVQQMLLLDHDFLSVLMNISYSLLPQHVPYVPVKHIFDSELHQLVLLGNDPHFLPGISRGGG